MSNKKTIDDKQLQSILSEVTSELDTMMKAEMEKLAKARPGEETTGEGEDSKSKTDPKGESTSKKDPAPAEAASGDSAGSDSAGSDSAPPAADASASSADAGGSAPPADASAGGADPGSASADPAAQGGPIDPQALVAEYAQLPPEDLKMHYLACKEALVQVMGAAAGAPGADPSAAGAPPPDASASAGPPAAAASAPAPGADPTAPTLKSEVPSGNKLSSPGPANGENPLNKAEQDVAALKEQVGILTKAVKKVFEAPLRKSITSVADLGAPATAPVASMSRETIRAKLKNVNLAPLSKADRELIAGYDLGTVKADQVAHLLK